MQKSLPNITRNSLQTILVYVAAMLVLLASCSIKSGIKNLTGLPVNVEQGMTTNSHRAMANVFEVCTSSVLGEVITQSQTLDVKELLPALIFAVTFLLLFRFSPGRQQSHPLYSSKKIVGTLPLYIQYQHLRLFS